jgi:hypothetical protein
VVFLYEGNIYSGKIISFNKDNVYISAVVTSLKSWKWLLKTWEWPQKPDTLEYELSDALGGINPPKLASNRRFCSISELSTFFEFGLPVSGL